jgi:hypothetical protein
VMGGTGLSAEFANFPVISYFFVRISFVYCSNTRYSWHRRRYTDETSVD